MNTTQLSLSGAAAAVILESTAVTNVSRYEWLKALNGFNAKYTMPVIVLSGIVGNLLALAVFICSPLRRLTISVYLAALSFTDFVFLGFLGLGWLDSMQINVFAIYGLCQVMVYMTYVVSFLSLWLIVSFTAELYFSIHCSYLHRKISRPKRALAIVLMLVVVSCCIYLFSFWLTRVVRLSDSKVSCQFNGTSSVAMAVSIMDSFFTLIFPFSLLIYMNIRILYTVASVSKEKFKRDKVSAMPVSRHWDMKSGNLLAKLYRMAAKGRRNMSRNSSHRSKASPKLGDQTSETIDMKQVKRISLHLSDGEIKINNSKGQTISVANLIVKNDGLGIRVERCRSYSVGDRDRLGHKKRTGNQRSRRQPTVYIEPQTIDGNTVLRARASFDLSQNKGTRNMNSSTMNCEHERQPKSVNRKRADDIPFEDISKDSILSEPFLRTCNEDKAGESETDAAKSLNPLTKLQKKCFRMVVAVALVFLLLNLPSHVIRLQGLLKSLFNSSYKTTELEFHLQQLFQTIYYLNYVVNIITYSACAKRFRMAFLHLPWHVGNFVRQIFRSCFPKKKMSTWARQRQLRDKEEHSRLVEICIPALHLAEVPPFAPDYKHVSPPCLLQLESSREKSSDNSVDPVTQVPSR